MNKKLDEAFDLLEFDVTEQIRTGTYFVEIRKVATGVTDGLKEKQLVRDLTENLRALPESNDPLLIRNDAIEEVAKEFDKMVSFGDTSSSFAAFVRAMKT